MIWATPCSGHMEAVDLAAEREERFGSPFLVVSSTRRGQPHYVVAVGVPGSVRAGAGGGDGAGGGVSWLDLPSYYTGAAMALLGVTAARLVLRRVVEPAWLWTIGALSLFTLAWAIR